MNPNLKTIPIPPALKNRTKRSPHYRDSALKLIKQLQSEMLDEVNASTGDVRVKREWMLEGANRVITLIRRIKYRGRSWRV